MPKKPANFRHFTQLLERLGVDENFEHVVQLSRAIHSLLKHGITNGFSNTDAWKTYLQGAEEALAYFKSIGKRETTASGRSPNPLAPVAERYPLAAALTQPQPPRNGEVYFSLQTFLLSHLLGKDELDAKQISTIAQQIRLAGSGEGPRAQLLSEFPDFIEDRETYVGNFARVLRTPKALTIKGVGIDFRNAIQRLVDKPLPRISLPTSISFGLTKPRNTINGIPLPSKPNRGKFIDLPIPIPGEPPMLVTGFIEVEDEDESTDDEVEADTRQSGYWLSRLQSRTEISWEVFTPQERDRFVSALKIDLGKKANNKIPALLLSLMYLTGTELKTLLTLSCGSMETFTETGKYRKKIHQPHQGFMPNDDQLRVMHEKIEYLNLELPQPVAYVLSELISDSTKGMSLAKILDTDFEKESSRIKTYLKNLRKHGQFRIKQANISAALAAEIDISYRNDTVTYLLAGTDSQKCPMLHYYQAIEEQQLLLQYTQITRQLFLGQIEANSNDTLDAHHSIPYPISEARKDFVQSSITRVSTALLSDRLSLAEKHNQFTDYVISLLMFATSHRPIRDPFCYFDDIDLDSGFIVISDKHSNDNQSYRLSILPTVAIAQLKLYRQHLLGLAWLIRDRSTDHKNLSTHINALSQQRGKAKIPLFFHLNSRLTRTISIRQSTISKYIGDLWVFPINFNRRVLATESEKLQIPTNLTKNQLGHSAGVDNQFGKTSMLSPQNVKTLMLPKLDESMHQAGWQAIPYKTSMVSKETPFITSLTTTKSPHLSSKLGPEIREENRYKGLKTDKQIVKQSTEKVLHEENTKQITEDVITKIINSISTTALLNSGKSNRALKLFYRWLGKQKLPGNLKKKYKRQFFIESEPSPLSKQTLLDAQHYSQIKSNFEHYLESKCRNNKPEKPQYADRIAEIIVSAAIFGKLANPVALEFLGMSISTHCRKLKGLLFVDIWKEEQQPDDFKSPYTRWFPEELSALLILGLHRTLTKNIPYDPQNVAKALQRLSKQITGESLLQKNLYPFWAKVADSALILEVPGYLRSAVDNQIPTTCLSTSTIFRMVNSKRVINPNATAPSVTHTNIVEWVYPNNRNQPEKQASLQQFEKAIRQAFSQTKKPVHSYDRYRKQRKKELIKKLQKAMKDQGPFPTTPNLLVAWIIYICTYGTIRKLNPAFKTIVDYRSLLQRPLMREAYDRNILDFDEDEFESLYTNTMESSNLKDNSNLAGVITQFHEFIVDNFGAVEIDTSAIWKNVEYISPSDYRADANLITHSEYQVILATIFADKNLSPIQRDQYAILLILGYHFGLRIGECFNLQLRDIQADEKLEEIYLLIRNNIFHEKKTPAAKRKIPLVECLTTEEKNTLRRTIELTYATAAGDYQATIMSKTSDPRQQISRSAASAYLNYQIKHVTGDMHARFHHLRHGFLNRVQEHSKFRNVETNPILESLSNQKTTQTFKDLEEKSLGRKTLKTLSMIAGHAHEKQTLTSYLHLSDCLLHENTCLGEQKFDDRLISYCTQRPVGTIRVMRSRSKSKGKSLVSFYKRENLKPIPQVLIESEPHPHISDSPNQEIYLNVTLESLERLLTININRQNSLIHECISQQFQLPISVLGNIISSAKQVELESSYEGYQVNQIAYDIITTPENIFVGNDNFRKLLQRTYRVISDVENLPTIMKAINVWSTGFYLGSKKLYLTSVDSAIEFVKGMNLLHSEELEYLVEIPHSFKNVKKELSHSSQSASFRYKMVEKIPKAHSKPGSIRGHRYLIKLKTLPKSISSDKQLNRLHFLIATYFILENIK